MNPKNNDNVQDVEIVKINTYLEIILKEQERQTRMLERNQMDNQVRYDAIEEKLETRRKEFDTKYAGKWVEGAISAVVASTVGYLGTKLLGVLIPESPKISKVMEYPISLIIKK